MRSFLLYLTAIVYFRTRGNCSVFATVLGGVSHDTLTRFLKRNWSGQKQLEQIVDWHRLRGGYLIVDTTEIEHPYASELDGCSWVYSSTHGKIVFGYQLVLLIWTDGRKLVPIGIRLYRKGGPTKIQLTLELLSYARNTLHLLQIRSLCIFDN